MGSNTLETKFRVLKIDRTVPHELIITDDKVLYRASIDSFIKGLEYVLADCQWFAELI